MNYIELINHFWQTNRISAFSANEAMMYFALLNECNLRGWENPFECSNRSMLVATGFSNKTIVEVRNKLKQKGMIDFENGKKKEKSPVYKLLFMFPYETKNVTKTGTKKEKNKKENFQIPTISEIQTYCAERSNGIDPQRFFDFYQSKGWMVGRNPMKDWKAAVRTWEGKNKEEQPKQSTSEKKVIYEASGMRKTATEKIYNADVKLYGDSIKFIQYC